MFGAQMKINKLQNTDNLSLILTALSPLVSTSMRGKNEKKSASDLRTQAAHDLNELLQLKTAQIEKYGEELVYRSNFLRRHPIVQSFLLMQMNRKKDNPGLNRRGLAQIVAQSFNRWAYTGRKIEQSERLLLKACTIPRTNVGKRIDSLSWVQHEDLVFSIKE